MIDDDIFEITADEPATDPTIMDALQNELKKAVRNEPLTLTVPNRPTISLVFDPNIEAIHLQMWRKASADKTMPDKFDSLKFSCIVVANTCTNVMYDGAIMTDTDGHDLKFSNKNFLKMLGSDRAVTAVRQLYGADGHIFIAASAIMTAAGYDEDEDGQDQAGDPTMLT